MQDILTTREFCCVEDEKKHAYAWYIVIILIRLKAESYKTYIENALAGNCRNNYSTKKKIRLSASETRTCPKNLRYTTLARRCCTLELSAIHGEAATLPLFFQKCIGAFTIFIQIIISDILSVSIVFFFFLGNRTRFMLTNIRISMIYNRLPTVFIGFSRFCRGL